MSLGSSFIKMVLDSGGSAALRDVQSIVFNEEEKPLYDFVTKHHKKYGKLPSLETVQAHGHVLPRKVKEGNVAYYRDKLNERFSYEVIAGEHPKLVEAMQGRDVDGAIRIIHEMHLKAKSTRKAESLADFATVASAVLEDYGIARQSIGQLRGVTLGWDSLDAATMGLQGGDVAVVVGRPGMGKSWVLTKMASMARKCGNSGLVATLEMGLVQLGRRWIGLESGINPNLIRSGQLSPWAEKHLKRVIRGQNGLPPFQFLGGNFKHDLSEIRIAAEDANPDIIYIDAAYLLSPEAKKKGFASKWETLSEVIGEIKLLALALNRPIVISVQFNRNAKETSTKDPSMSDIGGTDSIPQDASLILGLQYGVAPFERLTRKVIMMKNREGELISFYINFGMTPPDLSEYFPETEDTEEDMAQMGWAA